MDIYFIKTTILSSGYKTEKPVVMLENPVCADESVLFAQMMSLPAGNQVFNQREREN